MSMNEKEVEYLRRVFDYNYEYPLEHLGLLIKSSDEVALLESLFDHNTFMLI